MNRRTPGKIEVDAQQTCPQEPKGIQSEAYHRLQAAVLLQAVWDATNLDPLISGPARWWLAYDGRLYCQVLGINPAAMQGWLEAGCPRVRALIG
jgi:hypothetical protein